jgi:hypothetical protein
MQVAAEFATPEKALYVGYGLKCVLGCAPTE